MQSKNSEQIDSLINQINDLKLSSKQHSKIENLDKKQLELAESSTDKKELNEENNSFITLATKLIKNKYLKKQKRNIWAYSKWKDISELENDDVGSVGEEIINEFCKKAQIVSEIDGSKTKQIGGGIGDGLIKGQTCEIKTARLGSLGISFQHELGEVPWKAKYMIFLDIAPEKMYITIFPNFTEEFYKKSGEDSSNKCSPYFPTKSITWRKKKGAFKLDTSIKINEKNKYTFIIDNKITDYSIFKSFVDNIIQ
tara:strand:- start:250 stop:1011 length:762 start_codon:yes stop_codon:yes gene_type:complete